MRILHILHMQVLETRKIEDESQKEVFLEILSDKYCREILKICMSKPKSAIEISVEGKIPISTVYRRIQKLFDKKILKISGSISEEGKKFFLYKSKVKAITTSYDKDLVKVEIIPNLDE